MWARLTNPVTLSCLLLSLSNATAAQAVAAQYDEVIGFDQAIERTLEENPALVAIGYQVEAQRGRIQQSKLRPSPELDVSVENAIGTGIYSGFDSAEVSISVAWVLERGKRERRIDAARAGGALLQSNIEISRLDAAAETGRLYLQCLANQIELRQTEEAVRLAQDAVAAVRKRVKAGRVPAADLARAEVELSRVRLNRDDLRYELSASHRRLAAQWGDIQPTFASVTGGIPALPTPDSYASLLARIDQNPKLEFYLSEKRLRQAQLRLAESRAKPDWRISAGVRQLQQTNDQALMAGITIPLATRNRNQGRIAELQADMAVTDANRTATRIQIETQLFSLYQDLQYNLQRARVLTNEILPRVETALTETKRAYELGRYAYFEFRNSQADVLLARTAVINATLDAHRNVIEIERLTGTSISSPVGR